MVANIYAPNMHMEHSLLMFPVHQATQTITTTTKKLFWTFERCSRSKNDSNQPQKAQFWFKIQSQLKFTLPVSQLLLRSDFDLFWNTFRGIAFHLMGTANIDLETVHRQRKTNAHIDLVKSLTLKTIFMVFPSLFTQ